MIEQAWNYRSVVAKDINNTEGCGSVSKYAPRYFKIDWDKADAGWGSLLAYFDNDTDRVLYKTFSFAASIKMQHKGYVMITSAVPNDYKYIIAFSFIPLCASANMGLGVDWIKTIEEYIITTKFLTKDFLGEEINLSMDGLTEITEEEFYKID